MSLLLDGQFVRTEDKDPYLVLLSNHHYGCPASLTRVQLATDPIEQTFVPDVIIAATSIEPIQRGMERLWYDVNALQSGVYTAVSVKEHDYVQTVWLEIRDHRLTSVTTNKGFALSWCGRTVATLTMLCGHVETVRVYGAPQRRQHALERLPYEWCNQCAYAVMINVASAQNQGLGCSPLYGSPKQIGWAETIRWRILKDLIAWEEQWDAFEAALSQHRLYPEDADHYLFCLKVQDRGLIGES